MRFTIRVRTLMILVVLASIGLATEMMMERSLEFSSLSRWHVLRALGGGWCITPTTASERAADYEKAALIGTESEPPWLRQILLAHSSYSYDFYAYHAELGRRYHYAAAHPWLIIPPDPPEPN